MPQSWRIVAICNRSLSLFPSPWSSLVLSKIVRVEIPTGYSVETKGISIKYAQGDKGEEEGICILDSAGFETPLLKETLKPAVESIKFYFDNGLEKTQNKFN